jgi:hypothetical protein
MKKKNKININMKYNLTRCDAIANNWVEEFKTIFPDYFEKHWAPGGQHCLFKINKWDTTHKLVFSNSNALAESSQPLQDYPKDTVIAWEEGKKRLNFCIYYYRNNPFEWSYFEKINEKEFLYFSAKDKNIKKLSYATPVIPEGKTKNEIENFKFVNLYAQMVSYYKNDLSIKAKGGHGGKGKKKPGISLAQRKEEWNCNCEWDGANSYNKDLLHAKGAYNIAVNNWGEKRTYQGFKLALKRGSIEYREENKSFTVSLSNSVINSSGEFTSTINNNIYKEISEFPKNLVSFSSLYSTGELTSNQQAERINQKGGSEEYNGLDTEGKQVSKDNISIGLSKAPVKQRVYKATNCGHRACPVTFKAIKQAVYSKAVAKIDKEIMEERKLKDEYEKYFKEIGGEGYAYSYEEWLEFRDKINQ